MIVRLRFQQRYRLSQHHAIVEIIPATLCVHHFPLYLPPREVVGWLLEVSDTAFACLSTGTPAVSVLVMIAPVAGAIAGRHNGLTGELRQRTHERAPSLVDVHPEERLFPIYKILSIELYRLAAGIAGERPLRSASEPQRLLLEQSGLGRHSDAATELRCLTTKICLEGQVCKLALPATWLTVLRFPLELHNARRILLALQGSYTGCDSSEQRRL
mmetsp:Transcript_2184/g.5069  ORF Transcript_2184/g.5069 Transcript_2184/m.5069 type:complete len:215 (+) Transcript_2184:696-1340(+)